jgi:hypothetical protein
MSEGSDDKVEEAVVVQKVNESPQISLASLVPIIICACLSVLFRNFGLLALFFMAPLAYAILVYKQVWPTFIAVTAINAVYSIISGMIRDTGNPWMEILYFTTLFMCIIFIMGADKFGQIRTAYRFVIASAAGFLGFLIFILTRQSSGFYTMLREMADFIARSIVIYDDGGDFGRSSILSGSLTAGKIAEMSKDILLRGGILSSMFFLFFVSRYIAQTLAMFIKRRPKDAGLISFFVPQGTIWVFSGMVVFVLITRMIKADFLQIIAWNLLVICAILFFAQGIGLVMHLLAKKTPAFRMFINVLIIVSIFSPLIMLVFLAVLLLGVLEAWMPFRRVQLGNIQDTTTTP